MKVVISGSFRKHLQGILRLKKELEERGIEVIKPNRVKTIKNIDNPDFVKFEGEENVHPYTLEREYFNAIEECDAHIIYNQDSYLGQSATYELGASMANVEKTKVYFIEKPNPNKMIEKKGDIDEGEKKDIIEFCELLEDMEKHGVLGLYTDNIDKAFNKCKEIGAKILYKPEKIPNSFDNYTCFAIEDLDGNKIEISYYDKYKL